MDEKQKKHVSKTSGLSRTKSQSIATVEKNTTNLEETSLKLKVMKGKAREFANGNSQETIDQRKTDETDGKSVAWKIQEIKETMTSENYVQLLQTKLIKKCQSYLNGNDSTLTVALLSVGVTAELEKRILNALQVILIYFC